MMQLEIDTISPPLSPAMHTTFQHMPPPMHMQSPTHIQQLQHIPPLTLQSTTPEPPERFADIDVTELRKLYVAAMRSLKAEKQQRIPPFFVSYRNYT
jgi:hypothetical protein